MGKKGIVILVVALLLTGCSVERIQNTNAAKAEYTVVAEADMPEEVKKLADEKKEQEFQMTYEDGGWLYLLKGYGKQESGGYSIEVENVEENDTTIFLTTNLLGPDGEETKKAASYPYIVIKMEARDKSVQFQ